MMDLKEFSERGYDIYFEKPVVKTVTICIEDLINGEPLKMCDCELVDEYFDECSSNIAYGVMSPNGDYNEFTSESEMMKYIDSL